ncbi:MAG: hypothetical protein Q4D04_09100 [Clostridia bacterium]|nr:hypothetical protein [Clostridia bacterium]
MKDRITYPRMRKRFIRMYEARFVARCMLAALFAFAAFWNMTSYRNGATENYFDVVSLYYIWVIYRMIFSREIIETGFIQWLYWLSGMGIFGVLLGFAVGTRGGGMLDAITQSMAVTLLICSVVYFLNFRRQRHNIAPFLLMLVVVVALGALLAIGVVDDTVSLRALISYAAVFVAVALAWFREDIWAEIRKKLHS